MSSMFVKLFAARARDLVLLLLACSTCGLALFMWCDTLQSAESTGLANLFYILAVVFGALGLCLTILLFRRLALNTVRLTLGLWHVLSRFGWLRVLLLVATTLECSLIVYTAAIWHTDVSYVPPSSHLYQLDLPTRLGIGCCIALPVFVVSTILVLRRPPVPS